MTTEIHDRYVLVKRRVSGEPGAFMMRLLAAWLSRQPDKLVRLPNDLVNDVNKQDEVMVVYDQLVDEYTISLHGPPKERGVFRAVEKPDAS